jgi:dienelactone hydrolase
MMRRRDLVLAGAAALARARAADYRDYSRQLPDFLRRLAREAYQKRDRELEALRSRADIERRQRWVRETFWRLAGGAPERAPLNARVIGSFERPGYKVEKIVYESRPRFHIPANLYIPAAGSPPFPGVLFQMGHSLNGKAAGVYQKCCQGLARLGYLVLAFDPMGQGERTYYPRPDGVLTRLRSADDEHTVPGRQLLLAGDTATRLQTWDAVRSLDYLAAHPLVDPKRLASTGQSGGGTLTMLLACADDRLACAAPSCANTENLACADFNPPGSTDDAEQNMIGAGGEGFDRWDWLYPLAPKPLLVLASAKDFFGTYSPRYVSSGREEFAKLRRVYSTLGAADRIAWHETPLPHGLTYEMRLEIYRWFGRWLKGDKQPVEAEPPVEPEADETLYVAPSGNVVRSFGSKTPYLLAREAADAMATPPAPVDVAARIGARLAASPRAWTLGRSPGLHATIEAIEVASEPGVFIPAWLFAPKKPDPARPLIVALEGNRNARWNEDALWQRLAADGVAACACDVRGSGDLTPEFPRGAAGHGRGHMDEEPFAWSSLMLGRPLLGQRVTDLVAVIRAVGAHPAAKGRRVVVAASDRMTPPALFAAALEPSVAHVYLSGGLVSYRSLLAGESYHHPFANFLPGVLAWTDLPQVAASMMPRRVTLAGPVDGAGKPVAEADARRMYGSANVTIAGASRWDRELFLRL